MNAEQASKRAMRKPTHLTIWDRPMTDREVSDTGTGLFPPGSWHWHAGKKREVATREALTMAWHGQPVIREDWAGLSRWRRGP